MSVQLRETETNRASLEDELRRMNGYRAVHTPGIHRQSVFQQQAGYRYQEQQTRSLQELHHQPQPFTESHHQSQQVPHSHIQGQIPSQGQSEQQIAINPPALTVLSEDFKSSYNPLPRPPAPVPFERLPDFARPPALQKSYSSSYVTDYESSAALAENIKSTSAVAEVGISFRRPRSRGRSSRYDRRTLRQDAMAALGVTRTADGVFMDGRERSRSWHRKGKGRETDAEEAIGYAPQQRIPSFYREDSVEDRRTRGSDDEDWGPTKVSVKTLIPRQRIEGVDSTKANNLNVMAFGVQGPAGEPHRRGRHVSLAAGAPSSVQFAMIPPSDSASSLHTSREGSNSQNRQTGCSNDDKGSSMAVQSGPLRTFVHDAEEFQPSITVYPPEEPAQTNRPMDTIGREVGAAR